jgi:signal transduction histidine kinase
VVVALVCVVAYAVHSRVHYDEADRTLASAVEHLAEEYTTAATSQDRAAMLAVPVAPSLVVWAYAADGRLLAASPNAPLAPAAGPDAALATAGASPYDVIAALAPPTIRPETGHGVFGLLRDAVGRRWRLYVLPVDGARQYLIGAAPLDGIDASIADFRRLMAALAVLASLLTLLAAWLLASRALRPLATLTETAGAIARSRSFAERVPVGGRRDELGLLASTFNEMLASLERAYQTQQRFVADASHELRAPLTAIQANLQLLERQPAMSAAERQEALGEASREARRLARLVADLLALARADSGATLRRQRVELDRVLLETMTEARHLARGQQVEIEALEPTLVEGDPDYLRQLLLILLDNALKYTPPEGAIRVGLRQHDGAAEVTVRDTGVGIAAADLPHVFERFYRADPARARDPGGTGLGLPIARWIAEQHGGDVGLASELGRGTTATLRLPVRY